MKKYLIKKIIPSSIWNTLRERKIIKQHAATANICTNLVSSYFSTTDNTEAAKARQSFPDGTKIIWQYWAQGFDNLPEIINECMESVNKYAYKYKIIRLSDSNLGEYLDIPEYILEKKASYGYTHFSDLLRLMLLKAYGGIWMDATIMLSGPIPDEYLSYDFFAFQRDPDEPRKDYWTNTYAYYFSWAEGFRVKLLNSFIIARPDSDIISALCESMMKWWKENDSLPDYFFFQILFDVLVEGRLKNQNCPIVSDCPPHYLQQFRNDPDFFIKSEDTIKEITTIHKLTYK